MTTGLQNVLKNLNKEINKIEGDTFKGILAAVKFVEGEAVETTPVEHGPLSNSIFSDAERLKNKSVGRVGYTAKYAPFVHEMPASNNFTKSGTGPKFLERAVSENHAQILKIIQKRTKIK